MKGTVFFFCYFAWGHMVPMYPLMRAFVKRDFAVRVYTAKEFAGAVEDTGAIPVLCDDLYEAAAGDLKEIWKDAHMDPIREIPGRTPFRYLILSKHADPLIGEDTDRFHPLLAVVDSNAVWGKLLAAKYKIPMVESSARIPFNMFSMVEYDRKTFLAIEPFIGDYERFLGELAEEGFPRKTYLSLWLTGYETDCIFFQERFMLPCIETYDLQHMFFAGRSGRDPAPKAEAEEKISIPGRSGQRKRPHIFVTMGTVSSVNTDLWRKCIKAFADMDADVVMIIWRHVRMEQLGDIPDHINVLREGDERVFLLSADVMVCHGGMGAISDGLWNGVPMVFLPLLLDQFANARLVEEQGAGISLLSPEPGEIRSAVEKVLETDSFRQNAKKLGESLHVSGDTEEAVEWILGRPGRSPERIENG